VVRAKVVVQASRVKVIIVPIIPHPIVMKKIKIELPIRIYIRMT